MTSMGGREMKPLLVRAGLALALSLAGYLFARVTVAVRRRQPLALAGDDEDDGGGGGESGVGFSERSLESDKDFETFPRSSYGAEPSTRVGRSRTSASSGDEDDLLPEFRELMGLELKSSMEDSDTPSSRASTPKKPYADDLSEMDEEIKNLKGLVQSLQERERWLEFQLLEYYGLKEQESTVRELENRLKVYSVEAKLFSMKIETLLAENRRLEAHLSDYSRVEADLEIARERIKLLKGKLKSETMEANEKVAALRERLEALQESEAKSMERNEELESGLMRLKDLEDEVAFLRDENLKLSNENLTLIGKLESVEMSASSANNPEAAEVLEESDHLRLRNEELSKEIEQLQNDRFTNVEEVVYLKLLNACLRYETGDHQYPDGKMFATDLIKTLSPKTEEKPDQIVIQSSNSARHEKFITDTDPDCSSSSRSSSITEVGELDDFSTSKRTSGGSGKTKFFGKLKKLVTLSHRSSASDKTRMQNTSTPKNVYRKNYSSDDMFPRRSFDSSTSCISMETSPSKRLMNLNSKSERCSFDDSRVINHQRCKSDLGSCRGHELFVLGEQNNHGSGSADLDEKEELKRLASTLMITPRPPQFRRRSEDHDVIH